MTTKLLTLTSHYNKLTLNIRINIILADELMTKDYPVEYIIEELDGRRNRYLTPSQVKRINGYFSKDCIDYLDSITYAD